MAIFKTLQLVGTPLDKIIVLNEKVNENVSHCSLNATNKLYLFNNLLKIIIIIKYIILYWYAYTMKIINVKLYITNKNL